MSTVSFFLKMNHYKHTKPTTTIFIFIEELSTTSYIPDSPSITSHVSARPLSTPIRRPFDVGYKLVPMNVKVDHD